MHEENLNFILKQFIDPEYIEPESSKYLLIEKQESGYTELNVEIRGENICIAQYDKKSRCGFWNRSSETGLSRCVDHAILQHTSNGWILHLIEMKSRVDNLKWFNIRLKNRASYLDIKALSAILDIHIIKVCTYTTYSEDRFSEHFDETNPRAKVAALGERRINPVDEWNSGKMHITIGLNCEIIFHHKSLLMNRTNQKLQGKLEIG